jgi:hypothetical protein
VRNPIDSTPARGVRWALGHDRAVPSLAYRKLARATWRKTERRGNNGGRTADQLRLMGNAGLWRSQSSAMDEFALLEQPLDHYSWRNLRSALRHTLTSSSWGTTRSIRRPRTGSRHFCPGATERIAWAISRVNQFVEVRTTLAHHLGKERRHCAKIIEAIQRRHKPIRQQFCSDAGVWLMRIDSELILSALWRMHDAGDPALPVHDALIVPARRASQAADLMVQSFEKMVGRASPCTVKIKP